MLTFTCCAMIICELCILIHSVHTPLSAGGGGGWVEGRVEPPTKFSKSGGLAGSQFLEGGCLETGGDFFPGGSCSFYIKNILKREIFNYKKSL